MKKNMKLAVLWNLLIGFIALGFLPILLLPFKSLGIVVNSLILGLVPIILYFIAGTKFQLQEDALKDFLSLLIIPVIGISILISYIINSPLNGTHNNETYLFFYYLFLSGVNYFEYIYFKLLNIELGKSIILLIIQAFIPSILFWCGLEYKRFKKR